MGEQYRFFDSVDGKDERYYTADEFAEYFRQLITSGIFNGGENLRVTTAGTNMSIDINEGYAWLEGYLYKIDIEPLSLRLDAADPALNRIDRIIIRLDKSLEKRYVRAFILKGEAAEEPIAPILTRDENIYEISLARIKVLAGKSFIGEAEITDERFDEEVCGIVNSLIKIDTSHLIKAFEGEWQSWFNGIKDKTFVPIGNLKDGFIRLEDDSIYSIPNSKLQEERGWPLATNNPQMKLEGLGVNSDGDLYINTLKAEYISVFSQVVEEELESESLHMDSQLAVPFTVSKDVKQLEITMKVKRKSIGRIRCSIYQSNDEGLPDFTNELGRYFADNYQELDTIFAEATWEIPFDELLKTDKQYFLVIYSPYKDHFINATYKDSPGEVNYYITKDKGESWQEYERTPHLVIAGKELIDEGVVTIDYSSMVNFKKHGLINLKIIDNIDSYYLIDVLDLEDNILKSDIKVGAYLFDDDLSKDTKFRIRLIKQGEEEPKLKDYEHLWVADTSEVKIQQAIVPSENKILSYPKQITAEASSHQENGVRVLRVKVGKGGRYRIKCELRAGGSTVYTRLYVFYAGIRIGYASIQGDSYTEASVDLDSVPPNSELVLNLGTNLGTKQTLRIRNVELCGESGYQENEIYE